MVKPQDHPAIKKVAVVKTDVATPNFVATKPEAVSKARAFESQMPNFTEVTAYGRGPYICSPSGFGQKSHCVARSLFIAEN